MTPAIIITFNNVPIPAFCFSGIHSSSTPRLIKKVRTPMLSPVVIDSPSAKTVHGVTPFWETTNILSPKPNKNKPKQRKRKVSNLGKIIFGFDELQDVIGTELIEKAREINSSVDLIKSMNLGIMSELNIRSI